MKCALRNQNLEQNSQPIYNLQTSCMHENNFKKKKTELQKNLVIEKP